MMEEGQKEASNGSLPVFGDKFIKNLQFLKIKYIIKKKKEKTNIISSFNSFLI